MKSFDAFGKPVQEFAVKTTCGGYLSLCSFVSVAVLLCSELVYFLQYETKDEMVIDQSQETKMMDMSLDITLPNAPCALLSVNLLDPKQANVMHVATNLYMTRLSAQGTAIGTRTRESLSNVASTAQHASEAGDTATTVKTSHATTHLRCPSCFQSHIDEDDCCATCEDVKKEFRDRGLNDRPRDYVFGQCRPEAYESHAPQANEGCSIRADLHMKKVPASLHIGVSRHFETKYMARPDREKWSDVVASLDFRHTINDLTFGPEFPGLVHVLNGRRMNNHTHPHSDHYHYNLNIIPTRYRKEAAEEIDGHQYSVTDYHKTVELSNPAHENLALGIILAYDFTPFEVHVTRSRKSMWHFLTECCAILGGIFAFTGMLDNFAYQINKSMVSRTRSGSGMSSD